jgi:hypothetical protein
VITGLLWVNKQEGTDHACCAVLQDIAVDLQELKGALERVKEGFAGMVAYFGDNAASMSSDSEFWSSIAAFVRALSQAQRDFAKQQQVGCQPWNKNSFPGFAAIADAPGLASRTLSSVARASDQRREALLESKPG